MSDRTSGGSLTTGLRRWSSWIAMALVVIVALAVGTFGGSERTDAERSQDLAASIRCPQCSSQSVAQSQTPSAKGVKVVIDDQIALGRSDEEIRDFVASRFGRDVLLDPSSKGFGALVWGLPVAAAIVAVGALVLRFGDWKPAASEATDEDRERVAAAMGASTGPGGETTDAP